jgi:hypothetical protein
MCGHKNCLGVDRCGLSRWARTAEVIVTKESGRAIELSGRAAMSDEAIILMLLEEGYSKKTWHGPNLRQSIKGVTARQAAWRPGPRRHNIWELTLHAAYWKYRVRSRLEGGKHGSFVLQGSNFFTRPEKGRANESAWQSDRAILEKEHRAMVEAIRKVLRRPGNKKRQGMLWGVAFHDVYHAGQIRLLRRLQER